MCVVGKVGLKKRYSPLTLSGSYSPLLEPVIFSRSARQVIKRNFSYIAEEDNGLDSNFLQWLVGFTDAEGSFTINPQTSKEGSTISKFGFIYKITLHKDDEKVLRYLHAKLKVGGVRPYRDLCSFSVSDKKGILLLISIFDKYNLNTSKYLDYLEFRTAFFYYINRDKNLDVENKTVLHNKIIELKNKMNASRVNFNRPENSKIRISKYWLLGFIEGDGTFFIRRDNVAPTFAVENTGVQLPVFLKIKEFLENSLGFDKYSLYKIQNTSIIILNTKKATSTDSKSSVSVSINNINVIHNYLIPFFSDVKFLTKKGKDFNDFRLISKAVYMGAHRKEDIKSLILKLANTMNNFRLSTYKGVVKYLNEQEYNKITTVAPTIERLIDGRVIDNHTKIVLSRQVSCVYEIVKNNGEIALAVSLTEAAAIVGLYPDTLSKKLDFEILNPDSLPNAQCKYVRVTNSECERCVRFEGGWFEINNLKIRRVRVLEGPIGQIREADAI